MDFFDRMVEKFSRLNKKMNRRKRVATVLSAVVVFVTTYALILPAITLDKDTAQQKPGIAVAASEANVEGSGAAETVPEETAPEETTEPEEAAGEEQLPEQIEEEPEHIEEGPEEIIEEEPEYIEAAEQGDSDENTIPSDESGEVKNSDGEEGDAAAEEPALAVSETLSEDIIATETLSPEELEAAVAAGEIELITEKTQLVYEYIDEEYEKHREENKDGKAGENTDDVDDGYFVYAEFDGSAKLPVGVELQVREITEESDPELYAMYCEKTLAEMQDKYDDNTGIKFAKFYDIGFVYNGKRIEPSSDVKVRIEYKSEIEVEKDVKVDTLHFDKVNDEKAEVIESEVNPDGKEKDRKNADEENEPMKAVEFTTDRF